MAALALCQRNAYLKEFTAKVVSCTEAATETKGKKKTGKPEQKCYDVVLNDTVLFPEGGGQPTDYGSFVYEQEGKPISVPVSNVYRGADGVVRMTVGSEVPADTQLQVKVDWERRYDHMQHHTAQHLISAVAEKLFGWSTVSWWLAGGMEPCQIDFGVAEIKEEDMRAVEEAVNGYIRDARSVNVHIFTTLEEARDHPLFRMGSRQVPERMQGDLRVIEIDGVDFNKCCGTHLKNISEMQVVHFVRYEKSKGNTKLSFVTGDRARKYAAGLTEIAKQLTASLSTAPENFNETITKIMNDRKDTKKALEKANKELAEMEAAKIIDQITSETKFLSLHRTEADLPFLDSVEKALVTNDRYSSVRPLLLLTAGAGAEGKFLLVGSDDAVTANGKLVATAMEGKGGGRKGRFQGSGNVDLREAAIKQVMEAV